MADSRHRTVIEFDVQASAAEAKLASMAAQAERLQKIFGGGSGAPNATTMGSGHAPSAPSGSSAIGGGAATAAGHAPAAPAGGAQAAAVAPAGHAPVSSGGGSGFGSMGAPGSGPSGFGGPAGGPSGFAGGNTRPWNWSGVGPTGTWNPQGWQEQQAREQSEAMRRQEFARQQELRDAWDANMSRIQGVEQAAAMRRVGVYGSALAGAAQIGGAFTQYDTAQRTAAISAQSNPSLTSPFGYIAEMAGARSALAHGLGGGLGTTLGGIAGSAFGVQGTMVGSMVGGALGQTLGTVVGATSQEDAAKAVAQGSALNFYAQVLQRRGNLDQQNNVVGMYGGRVSYMGAASRGFSPEEALSAYGAFGNAAGMSDAFRGTDVLGVARSTVGLGVAGGYVGLTAAGNGGTGQANVGGVIGLAQAQGLMGSNADRYLSTIASGVQKLAASGLTLDLSATKSFLEQLQGTEGSANKGVMQARAVNTLGDIREEARSNILAPFQGYAQSRYTASVYRHSKNLGEAVQNIEMDDSPQAVRDRLMEGGLSAAEAQALQFSLAGRGGLDMDMAGNVAGGELASGRSYKMRSAPTSEIKRQFAMADAQLLEDVGGGDAKGIAEALFAIQKVVARHGEDAVKNLGLLVELMQRAF